MKIRTHSLTYTEYDDVNDLTDSQQNLLAHAKENLSASYSPYSNFKVSASILLDSGEIIGGTNQENLAFPSGLCAERVAIFAAMSQFPQATIHKIAITAKSEKFEVATPITPCGACRQAMIEYRMNQNQPIELILHGDKGPVIVINDLQDLLPLHFCETNLKK